jgi:hypothetical protein
MLRARWQDFWPHLDKAQGGVLIELFAGEPQATAPKCKTGTCVGRSTELIEILKTGSNLCSFPSCSSLQELIASQDRRFEKTFLTMRVLEFTQMYSVVPIVLEIAVFPVDTD